MRERFTDQEAFEVVTEESERVRIFKDYLKSIKVCVCVGGSVDTCVCVCVPGWVGGHLVLLFQGLTTSHDKIYALQLVSFVHVSLHYTL